MYSSYNRTLKVISKGIVCHGKKLIKEEELKNI